MCRSRVIPVYKEGVKNDFGNYRPISLISAFGKLIEKIVAAQLTRFLETNNILYKHQYGFRSQHDCQQPLVFFTEKVRPSLDIENNCYSIAVFIDMKKAFDTIPFNHLISKLEFYGVQGAALKWFNSYLYGRQQCVEINGCRSLNREVKMGVPQGSILGPLLFLLYINDLPNSINKSTPILFADDTTVVKTGTNLQELYRDMNNELLNIETWCKTNKLSLNAKKN